MQHRPVHATTILPRVATAMDSRGLWEFSVNTGRFSHKMFAGHELELKEASQPTRPLH